MTSLFCDNILGIHNFKEKLKAMSKPELIAIMRKIDAQQLKFMLLKYFTHTMDMEWCTDLVGDWYETLKKQQPQQSDSQYHKSNMANATKCKLISSLPTSLGSYIISYCNMYERLNYKLICKHFYDFCGSSMAKSHLIIDRKFVKALAFNTINYREYCHAHLDTVDVKFVFVRSNQSKYPDAHCKQFLYLSTILESARNFKTLNYHLTHDQFQSSFDKKYLENYSWSNNRNYRHSRFIVWTLLISKVGNENNYKIFNSVQTLNIHESRHYHILSPVKDIDVFKQMFPRMRKLIIPKCPYNDRSGFWSLLDNKYYGTTLQHLEIDLRHIYLNINTTNMSIKKHPFYVLPYMKTLETLIVNITMEKNNTNAYHKLLIEAKDFKLKCLSLNKVMFSFDRSYPALDLNEVTDIVNNICRYTLDLAPNITDFGCCFGKSLMVNDPPLFDKLNYLVGHTDKLKSLTVTETNCLNSNNVSVPVPSLKTLTIDTYLYQPLANLLENINISIFSNLETISIWYKADLCNLNTNVIQFLKYLHKQKLRLKNLKYVSLHHEQERNRLVKGLKKDKKDVECDNKISEEICKLLVELNSLKTIEISPLFLQKQHYEYLSFWFGGNFGALHRKIYATKRSKI
eukprot:155909_1